MNFPVGVLLEVMVTDCSARARLVTGSAKVTSIGAATPTTSPVAGEMAVTARSDVGTGHRGQAGGGRTHHGDSRNAHHDEYVSNRSAQRFHPFDVPDQQSPF